MAYGPSGFAKNTATANYLSGRQAADEEHQANQLSRARDQSYQQNETAANDQQQQKAAQQLYLASQYALQQPAGQTKAFVEQNFPDLVTHAGAKWETATEDDVRAELEGARAQFGAQSGNGPAVAKGVSGAMYKVVDPETGEVSFATAEEARGKKPYEYKPPTKAVAPEKRTAPPRGYRYTATGDALEPIPGGPADPTSAPKPTQQKPPSEGERGAANFLGRMEAANQLIDPNFLPTIPQYMAAKQVMAGGSITSALANKTLDADSQKYYQAAADWVRAKLRKESGAAIGKDEMDQEIRTYFPMPGDAPEVLAQKAQARTQATIGMRDMAGRAAPPKQQQAPPAALEYLRANPSAAPAFKAKYGYLP